MNLCPIAIPFSRFHMCIDVLSHRMCMISEISGCCLQYFNQSRTVTAQAGNGEQALHACTGANAICAIVKRMLGLQKASLLCLHVQIDFRMLHGPTWFFFLSAKVEEGLARLWATFTVPPTAMLRPHREDRTRSGRQSSARCSAAAAAAEAAWTACLKKVHC